jgi:hypothetical protein
MKKTQGSSFIPWDKKAKTCSHSKFWIRLGTGPKALAQAGQGLAEGISDAGRRAKRWKRLRRWTKNIN